MGWLSFNGISTQEIPGVEVSVMPSHKRAEMRYTEFYVNGRDGALHIDNGLSNMELKAKLVVMDAPAETRQVVNAWLRGSGKLILSDDPTKCYRASVRSEVRWSRVPGNQGYFDTVDVSFDCEPYMYETVETPLILDQYDEQTPVNMIADVYNPGSDVALPLIEIEGYGGASVEIRRSKTDPIITKLTITGIPAYWIDKVHLDCESGYAYSEGNASLTLTGDFPEIPVGNSVIIFSSDVLRAKILWHWRWI